MTIFNCYLLFLFKLSTASPKTFSIASCIAKSDLLSHYDKLLINVNNFIGNKLSIYFYICKK